MIRGQEWLWPEDKVMYGQKMISMWLGEEELIHE